MSRVWDDQEKAVAKRRGGKQTRGSGSSWRNKSDVVEPGFRWEMKSTGAKSISVKAETWHKIRKEAILSGRMPVLHLQIGDTKLVVISEDDFDEAFPKEDDTPRGEVCSTPGCIRGSFHRVPHECVGARA